jgi:hypothetical protein
VRKRARWQNGRTNQQFPAQIICRSVAMTMRSRRETVRFLHPFRIKGIDRELSPGAYEVVSDEEMIEGLSFPCFRRVATMIMVPGASPHRSSMEMISISSTDLSEARRIDASVSRE